MAKFIVVYHRLPFEEAIEQGKPVLREPKSPNGIIPSLRGFFQFFDEGLWLAWKKVPEPSVGKLLPPQTMIVSERKIAVQCVGLSDALVESFYLQTSKSALWPILHSFIDRFDYDSADWDKFREVNHHFANAACAVADPGATIWIHDYNLWLVPGYIRARRPDVRIAFFHHTPFPASDTFGILPWRKEILESLLSCDRIGFHAPRYAENFASCARAFVKPAVSRTKSFVEARLQQRGTLLQESVYTSSLSINQHIVQLDVAPIGVDVKSIAEIAVQSSTQEQATALRAQLGAEKIIMSVGRIDYTKGTREMLLAFESLLNKRTDLHGKVKLCVTSVAPAAGIRAYDDVRADVERLVGSINGRFSTSDWVPILFFTTPIGFRDLIAWYMAADICWITPLRDGLNLVVKEYVAARGAQPSPGGVLLLSEFIGAAIELDEALRTHPYSARSMVKSIEEAIAMPDEEAAKRMGALYEQVSRYDIKAWTNVVVRMLKDGTDSGELRRAS